MKHTQFIGNTGTLFGQISIDRNLSIIDPISSISSTTPESSDASEIYNNSSSSGYVSGESHDLFVFSYYRIRVQHLKVKNNECYGRGNSIASGNKKL